MLPKKLKFSIIIIAIILLRITDLVVTYNYTPALSNELNPLVSVGNLDWFGFLVFQTLLTLVIIVCWAFFVWGRNLNIVKPGLKYTDFICYYFFDKVEPWSKRFFKFPKHKYQHSRLLAFVITVTSIFISVFAIIHNTLLLIEFKVYEEFLINFLPLYFSVIVIFAISISANLFFTHEFRIYKRTQEV